MKCSLEFSHKNIDRIVQSLLSDEIIISPTDTILGLGGRVKREIFEKLQQVKMRDQKAFIILINDFVSLDCIVEGLSVSYRHFVSLLWPAPVTCIFSLRQGYVPWLFEKQSSIAIRMPDHALLLDIIQQTGPLFSTSVNISKEPAAVSIEKINPLILAQVPLVFYQFNEVLSGASTIIDCQGTSPVLVRQGVVSFDTIVSIWQKSQGI